MRNSLTSIFARLGSARKHAWQFDPMRDWFAVLIVSAILLASIIVWNAWAFDRVASGGTLGAVATSTPSVFSRSSIDTIQTVFSARASEEAKYVTGEYRYADPSQ